LIGEVKKGGVERNCNRQRDKRQKEGGREKVKDRIKREGFTEGEIGVGNRKKQRESIQRRKERWRLNKINKREGKT
jgi:hypothetical protein